MTDTSDSDVDHVLRQAARETVEAFKGGIESDPTVYGTGVARLDANDRMRRQIEALGALKLAVKHIAKAKTR